MSRFFDNPKPVLVQTVTAPQAACRLMRGQLAWMRLRGFKVYVVSSPGPLLEDVARREEVETIGVPIMRTIAPFRDTVSLWRLWAQFRRLRPSIAHVSTPKAGLLGSIASFLAGVPVRIYSLRGMRLEGTRPPLRWILWACDRLTCALNQRVVCVSRSLREKAVSLGIVAGTRAIVIGDGSSNGVDVERFRPTPQRRAKGQRIRERLGIPREAKVLGSVGRLVRDKGVEQLLAAFHALSTKRKDVRLLLVGAFEPGDPVSRWARREIQSNPKVVRTGFVKDPEDYYHAMDMLVLATYREGFPNVVLEGGSAELPVITTTATGAVDSVIDGVTGLLVPPRDSCALLRAIERLLDNPDLARTMGRKARQRIQRDFTTERVWRGLLAVYEAMLSSRGLAGPVLQE